MNLAPNVTTLLLPSEDKRASFPFTFCRSAVWLGVGEEESSKDADQLKVARWFAVAVTVNLSHEPNTNCTE